MAISVEHFGRVYGAFTAVDDLSFDVAAGEIVGLIGPNGAGKTTTLRSLAGILRPTSGHLRIDGHEIVADPIEAKRRLAFMPDEPHLFEYLTVTEHLRLIARLYSVPDIDVRAAALVEELELKGKEGSLPGELSPSYKSPVDHQAPTTPAALLPSNIPAASGTRKTPCGPEEHVRTHTEPSCHCKVIPSAESVALSSHSIAVTTEPLMKAALPEPHSLITKFP